MSHQNKTFCAILAKNIMGNIYMDLILNLDQWNDNSRFTQFIALVVRACSEHEAEQFVQFCKEH